MHSAHKIELIRPHPIRAELLLRGRNDHAALDDSHARKGIWLEIRTDDPEALKQKILAFGVQQVEFWDNEHFYFQAPGGRVFRLVGAIEDMSK